MPIPSPEFIELHQALSGQLGADQNRMYAFFRAKTVLDHLDGREFSGSKISYTDFTFPGIKIDLPCIGADAIDPENVHSLAHYSPDAIAFRFYAFADGVPRIVESDQFQNMDCSQPNLYTLASHIEGPPFITQNASLESSGTSGVAENFRHYINPDEARDLGEAVLSLTPQVITVD